MEAQGLDPRRVGKANYHAPENEDQAKALALDAAHRPVKEPKFAAKKASKAKK